MYSSSHLGRQTPVRSHRPRLAGCQRERTQRQLLTPKLSQRGDDSTGVGRRTCPGMHSLLFSGDGSCQAHWPPQPQALPHHGHSPCHGGSWGHRPQALHGSWAAHPATLGLAHAPSQPMASPSAPEPHSPGHSSSNTQQHVCRFIAEMPHLHHFCDHVCVSALLQFRLSRGTNPDLDSKPPHSVSDYNVHEELLFCPIQCRALPCARPCCLGRGTRLLGSTAA